MLTAIKKSIYFVFFKQYRYKIYLFQYLSTFSIQSWHDLIDFISIEIRDDYEIFRNFAQGGLHCLSLLILTNAIELRWIKTFPMQRCFPISLASSFKLVNSCRSPKGWGLTAVLANMHGRLLIMSYIERKRVRGAMWWRKEQNEANPIKLFTP